MPALEVASLIGTWVAAIVAVVALIGIAGPVLIWRASRTQRHQALAAIGSDNDGFLSRGIHAGPGIYLRQQVRAPQLRQTPVFKDETPALHGDAFRRSSSPSSWINFASIISAYGVQYARGDFLTIDGIITRLPVHRLWILYLGIVGRFGERRDQGEFHPRRRAPRMGLPPGPVYPRRRARSRITSNNSDYSSEDSDRPQENTSALILYGLTGTIKAAFPGSERHRNVLNFESRSKEDLQQIRPDTLPLKKLFMAAIGSLPLHQNGQFFSLLRSFEEEDDGSLYSERSSDEAIVTVQRPRHTHHRRPRWHQNPPVMLNAYRLIEVTNHDTDLIDMSRPFRAENAEVFAFDKIHGSQSITSQLEGYAAQTYVPAESLWIRLPPASRDGISRGWQGYNSTYISRPDAHAIASAFLLLDWHPEGYLLGTDHMGLGLQLLTNISYLIQPILSRLIEGSDSLGLSDDNCTKLTEAIAPVLRIVRKDNVYPTRTYSKRLFTLDTVLAELGEQSDRRIIGTMIGVLMITNEEFQMLLYQSMRHIQHAAISTVEVNLQAGTMVVPSAFGVLQTFYIDMDKIDPGSRSRNPDALTISYPTVILAATRACLRSTMLKDSFDAYWLLQAVRSWDEVVYIQ